MLPSDTKDLYQRLGIHRKATFEEIKHGYRKMALRWHSDMSGATDEQFRAINEAYKVLTNASERKSYDAGNPMAGKGIIVVDNDSIDSFVSTYSLQEGFKTLQRRKLIQNYNEAPVKGEILNIYA